MCAPAPPVSATLVQALTRPGRFDRIVHMPLPNVDVSRFPALLCVCVSVCACVSVLHCSLSTATNWDYTNALAALSCCLLLAVAVHGLF